MIAFNKYYNKFNILSVSLVIVSLLLLTFKGLNFGIDFKGGTLIELRSTDTKINVSSLRDNLSQMNLGDVSVKNFGNETDFLITFEINAIEKEFREKQQKLQGELQAKQNSELERIRIIVEKAINEYAKDKDYDLILRADGTTLFAKKYVDITQDIINILN